MVYFDQCVWVGSWLGVTGDHVCTVMDWGYIGTSCCVVG